MRKLEIFPRSALVDDWRALARARATLLLATAAACMPVRDLSDYAASDAENAGSTTPPAEPSDVPDPNPTAPTPGRAPGEVVQRPGVPLGPSTPERPAPPTPLDLGDRAAADAGAPREASNDAGRAPADAAAPPPASFPPECAPDETTGPNGDCYVVTRALLGWDAARATCQSRGTGWDLTSVRSAVDSAFVGWLGAGEVWVGGSDAIAEDTWTWVNDGVAFWQGAGTAGRALNGAFANWFTDEPNGALSSDCLRLLVDARWADLECADLRASVCEGPKR